MARRRVGVRSIGAEMNHIIRKFGISFRVQFVVSGRVMCVTPTFPN
jgi:hypothetical protein